MFRDDSKDTGIINASQIVDTMLDLGRKSKISFNAIAHEIENRRNQNQINKETIVAVSDPKVEHILVTLNAKLGISMNLSDLSPPPANPIPNKLSKLALILGKTTLGELMKAQNITSYIDLAKVRNANGVKTPEGNYWLWMQGGLLYKGKCVNDATKLFSANERGGTNKEGLFLHLYYPELLNECFMDFAGSRYALGFVPFLFRWDDELRLDAFHPDDVYSYFGSVSAGVSLIP